ncbi:MAG: ABC transporter permease [Candidatus Omnitrophica bacterium]|nr:ABC transporter permease [Candidatus Omnitrophota bacterium]
MTFTLALRNVFRHKTRSIITLSTVAFGCVALIFVGGFFEDTFYKMREGYIRSYAGHLQVFKQGFLEKGAAKPFDYLIDNPGEIITLIQGIEAVQYVTRRIEFAGLISTGENSTSCIGQGIEPKNERSVRQSDVEKQFQSRGDLSLLVGNVIETGDPLKEDEGFAVLLGRGLASSLGAQVGDGLILVSHTIGGSINAVDVSLKGTFYTSTKDFDDHFLRLPLAGAQKLLHTDSVQSLVILLKKTEDTARVKAELRHLFQEKGLALELRDWEEINDFYTKTRALFGRFFLILKLVVAIIAILGIFNTMNMAVLERTAEIGTLMALGTKQKGVAALFLMEGGILGALGGGIGIIAGIGITRLIASIGIPMPPPPGATMRWVSEPMIVPWTILFAFALSMAASLLSSFYPAYKASRLEIAQALRYAG